MIAEALMTGDVENLHAAFRVFTDATANLEREYRRLQIHARALNDELSEKNRALTESLARQRELEVRALRQSRLAAMGEMAATLAHEVRNPLGATELFARLLLDEIRDNPRATGLAEQISRSVADLDHLVSNILDFTRLPQPAFADVRLDRVLDEALLAAGALHDDNYSIVRSASGAVPWSADRGLIRQALVNLIRNAMEAMAAGGRISVGAWVDGRIARISVADEGPGIESGQEDSIFGAFVTTKARGTGLGLAVARAAAVAHGGALELQSAARGAHFLLSLPTPRAAADMEDRS